MLAIGGFFLGAVIGALRARSLGGKPADLAQYALATGLFLGVIGLFAQILLLRSGI
ncbi:hypothetical protein HOY34_04705 [Xinfangfangia sp. D13-10-4-6]|uniref:hypothetical protein n=1 Tax=Pseudogemmobacter hezensis TaxID=2737662 RepID=UPI001555ABDE|nr:hypothetical protein [Pseudogemmobacter hezensis]NPD14500.1 hypothetical protein [Pseudogemmobacter hezensis]